MHGYMQMEGNAGVRARRLEKTRRLALSVSSGAIAIAEFPGPLIEVHCPRCDRRERYAKAHLVERFGAEVRLPDLLRDLAAGCPARNSLNYQSCSAIYPALRPHG